MRPNNLLAWFYMVLVGEIWLLILRAVVLIAIFTLIAYGIFSSAAKKPECATGFLYNHGICVIGYDPHKKS
ncbi:MAG: hypothetical protein EOP83_09820 [Verrucomicrobiaceae bacterium]|nr:MAG: hypothetical protein EOP83_09820 [Verrucomicrobiaceae bacterium]